MRVGSGEAIGRDLILFEKYSINAAKTPRGSTANRRKPMEKKNCSDWKNYELSGQ